MAHESVLVYGNFKYLKWSLLLVAVAATLYLIHSPVGEPNGGSWLGYTLGSLSAGITMWLAWLGIRKRSYGAGSGRLEDWLSAHIYLGLALVAVVTLHSGFQFGWNIHTLLYAFMVVVVLSGVVGVYFYLRVPKMLSRNRHGYSTEAMLGQIADLDRDIRSLVMTVDDETSRIVFDSVGNTRIGNGFFRKLTGDDPDCPTLAARLYVEQAGGQGLSAARRDILTRLVRKEVLLKRLRRDIQLRLLLQIWLYIHVPFTFAMLAALLAHVVTVFYYW